MNRMKKLLEMEGRIRWLLKDDFNDTVAAGAVNGTQATPIGGLRTATDTESKVSIGSGVENIAGGKATPAWGDPRSAHSSHVRTAGRAMFYSITPANTTSHLMTGWYQSNNPASNMDVGIRIGSASNVLTAIFNNVSSAVGTYTAATAYQFAVILRETGGFALVKGGAFTNWTLLYPGKSGTVSPQFPLWSNFNSTFTRDFVRIPQNLIYIVPLVSDGFGGTWGTTGGAGSEEAGGTGLTWTAQKGTWGNAAGVASCSALADSLGIATVPCGTTNVMVEAICTRAAGNSGLTLRWTDANNYIAAYLDGTNLVVVEVVAGTPNTLATTAVTYGATKRMVASCDQTKLRIWYGDAAVGSELTTAVVAGNAHGLYTSDTGATFDNFVVLPRGNSDTTLNFLDKYTR